jgi:DNA primase
MVLQTHGKFHSSNYTQRQVLGILKEIGVVVEGGTSNDYLCLCPYHSNTDTPAMTVSKTKGVFICLSPQCGKTGNLQNLIMDKTGATEFAALRMIIKHGASNADNFEDDLSQLLTVEPQYKLFEESVLSALADNMFDPEHPEALEYMIGRGFTESTIRDFNLGYSYKNFKVPVPLVTVPVRTPKGEPMGFIGRSIRDKSFINSPNLQKSETLFNLHRARKSSTVYVTEASFCAMKISQALGKENAVAIAGGNLSARQAYLLNMYFDTIVIMTDFDDKEKHRPSVCKKCPPPRCLGHNPGRDLGNSIVSQLSHKNILWGVYDYGNLVYAPGCKDPTDMTDEQIRQTAENAVPNFMYQDWAPY